MKSFTQLEGMSLNVAITIASGAGFLLFGYDQGFFGGILTNDAFLDEFKRPGPTLQGQIVALYDVGCMMGCVVSMYVGDRLGRKRSILVGSAILIVGAIIQSTSYSVVQMILGRIVAGVGNGMTTTAIPIWQAETAKANRRGALIVFQLVNVITGVAITNWMNYGFTFLPGKEVSWRFPIAFQIFFALITIALVAFLPESPRWLVLRDRTEEASQVLGRLRAKSPHDPVVMAEVQLLSDSVASQMAEQKGIGMREIFSGGSRQTFRRILLGMGTQFMQQMGDTNVVATYLPIVLTQNFGLSARLSLILSAVISHWLQIFAAGCAFLIDSVGRKRLMLWGAFFESICFAMIAAGLAVNSKETLIMAIAFIFLYYSAYGLSFLPIPFIYPAEINSQRMRNIGSSLSTLTNWSFCYLIVSVTPPGIANLGWKFYLIFAAMNAAFVPLVYFFYIETAKLSLEEIDEVFVVKHEKMLTYDQAIADVKSSRVLIEESLGKTDADEVEKIEFRNYMYRFLLMHRQAHLNRSRYTLRPQNAALSNVSELISTSVRLVVVDSEVL